MSDKKLGDKKIARVKRAKKTRFKIRATELDRLCIHRTPRHIYAQLISNDGSKVLASASTLDKSVEVEGYTGNVNSAAVVGKLIAERAKTAGVEKVAFDRSGFRYHGRVKSLADAAREAGLQF